MYILGKNDRNFEEFCQSKMRTIKLETNFHFFFEQAQTRNRGKNLILNNMEIQIVLNNFHSFTFR
jgi:hypothetical protein